MRRQDLLLGLIALASPVLLVQLEGAAPNAAFFKNLWIKLLPQ